MEPPIELKLATKISSKPKLPISNESNADDGDGNDVQESGTDFDSSSKNPSSSVVDLDLSFPIDNQTTQIDDDENKYNTNHYDSCNDPIETITKIGYKTIETNFNRFTCCVVYVFLSFLFFFGILLLVNNLRVSKREDLLNELIDLVISETTMETILEIQIALLIITPSIGFISLHRQNFRAFILFSLLLLWTFVWIILTVSLSMRSTAQMKSSIENRHQLIESIQNKLMRYDWNNFDNEISIFVNRLQFEYQCCGGENRFHDWERIKPKNFSHGMFPVSCCSPTLSHRFGTFNWCTYEQVEKLPGCSEKFLEHLIHLENGYRSMNILLLEAMSMILLATVMFCYLIIVQGKIFK
ncbi:ribosomal protein S6 kinase alpha-1-like [Sarcoptes scabiei]|nr:ribosomal protein S6 kinase alpha-1-like [Sarcoptes scabiei]